MFRRPGLRRPLLRRVAVFSAVAAVLSAGAVAIAAPASATTVTTTFTDTGAHAFQVPAGVSSVHVVALGGSGASNSYAAGGRGALVSADLQVTPASTLTVVVGGNGSGQAGGTNGGGDGGHLNGGGGGGGGGATDVRSTAGDLASRLLVAGGGGGYTYSGTPAGDAGSAPVNTQCGSTAQPGSANAGGAGGTCNFGSSGTDGALGQGGSGGADGEAFAGGGGGGGGLYGGGGGNAYTGGAGGSSSTTPNASNVTTALGDLGAAPYATISFVRPPLTGITVTTPVPSILADGKSYSIVVARLTNVNGTAAVGETVNFSSDGGNTFTKADDNGDGSYTAAMFSTTTVGTVTVTGTVSDGTNTFSGTTSVAQTVGPVTKIAVTSDRGSLVADGTSTADLTAIATDAAGHRITGDQLVLSSDDAEGGVGALVQQTDGSFDASYTASTVARPVRLTVTDQTVSPQVTGTVDLTQTAGPAATIASSVSAASIPADGVSTTTVTTRIEDANGNGVQAVPVTLTSSDPEVTIGATSEVSPGTYTTTVTASTSIQRVTLTVSAGSASTTVDYDQVLGAPSTIAPITFSPSTIAADGTSSTLLVATVTDAAGHPIRGEDVAFTTDDPDITVRDVADRGDGTYSVRIFSSTTVHPVTVTVTDRTPPTPISGTATFQQIVGAPSAITVTAPPTLVADGTSTGTVTVSIADRVGHPVPDQDVRITSTDPGQTISAVTDNHDGSYSATVTASTNVGQNVIEVHAFGGGRELYGTVTIVGVAGPVAKVSVTASSTTIAADGASQVLLTATVTDAQGHPLRGQGLQFVSTDGGQQITNAVDYENGIYDAFLTASKTVGVTEVRATVLRDGVPFESDPLEITQTVGAPAAMTLTPSSTSTVADGASTITFTARITDAEGRPLDGRSPAFTTGDARTTVSAPVAAGNGTYTVVVTSSTVAGTVVLSARDEAASADSVIALLPGAPVKLVLTTGTPMAVGHGKVVTAITATVTDAFGNIVSSAVPAFRSSDPRVELSDPIAQADGSTLLIVTAPAGVGTTVTASFGDLSAQGAVAAVTPVLPGRPVTPVLSPTDPTAPVLAPAGPVSPAQGADPAVTLVVRTPSATQRSGTDSLAYTGSDAAGAGFAALALLAAGLLLRVTRRRRAGRES